MKTGEIILIVHTWGYKVHETKCDAMMAAEKDSGSRVKSWEIVGNYILIVIKMWNNTGWICPGMVLLIACLYIFALFYWTESCDGL